VVSLIYAFKFMTSLLLIQHLAKSAFDWKPFGNDELTTV